ncbi:FG-GAP-like repeat-containing protein [Aequorivita capsosiphonis]|uniref:FG-GAP-like repeat-containing protein n=1 Tax=Aequorivita capsosiphonis TaxID=487317 RepID=UPI0004203DD1|nr:FG-GAP-like repeat-containing protein [Aequorivita capsosiphonis]
MKILIQTFIFVLTSLPIFSQIGFTEHIIIDKTFAADGATSVFAADIDGDGDEDLLSASITSGITWYANNNGSFQYGQVNVITDIEYLSRKVYAADLDGDGDMDVIAGFGDSNEPSIGWYENLDGLGNFGPKRLFPSSYPSPVGGIFAADLDGDGDMDVITGSWDLKVSWHENLDGLGNFGPRQILLQSVSGKVNAVYADDLDGDGDLDIIAAKGEVGYGGVYWFENLDGVGGFGTGVRLIDSNTTGFYDVTVTDIDNDGDKDIIAVTNVENKALLYKNTDGQGTFATPIIITNISDLRSVQAADIDGDLDMDLVFGKEGNALNVFWIENIDGQGNFGSLKTIGSNAPGTYSIYVFDSDSDGDLDVVSASKIQDKVALYENIDGLGTFGEQQIITENADGASCVVAADINNDGTVDVVSGSWQDGKVAWYNNLNGAGSFSHQNIVYESNENELYTVIYTDIDGDGDNDLVTAIYNNNSYSKIIWFENLDGLGNYGPAIRINSQILEPKSIFAADFDGDGDMDILAASQDDNKITWFENTDGAGNFGPQNIISTDALSAKSVFACDFDGDTDMDVVSASSGDNKIAWYENTDGQGSFSAQQIVATDAMGAHSVQGFDVDNDGDNDIVSASQSDNKIAWYENLDGTGTFSEARIITTNALEARSVFGADIDNDGDLDVISASFNDDKIAWYENKNGLGNFGAQQVISSVADGAHYVYAKDIDGDGDMDILSASQNDNKIAWYENLGTIYNAVNGKISFDTENNGCSTNSSAIANVLITTDNGTDSYATFSQNNGLYSINTGQGNFITTIAYELPFYYDINPVSYNSNFTGLGEVAIADFCIQRNQSINDLNISVYPLSQAQPGFDANYQIVYSNVGSTELNGNINLTFDGTKLSFLDASEPVTSQTTNSLTFDYAEFLPFETRTIDVNLEVAVPPINQQGDILTFVAEITPVSGDYTEEDNIFTCNQTVVNSFDPNDIQVLEGDEILLEQADDFLHYIIRFQNVGTAAAINVKVTNSLDANLDWTTLQLQNTSHNTVVEIRDGGQLTFRFDGINLPASTINEHESHGYIQYKIKPINSLDIGDNISNLANIYFDFNAPIITNTVTTTIVDELSIENFKTNKITIYPNPTKDVLHIKTTGTIVSAEVYNQLGQPILIKQNARGIDVIDVFGLEKGLYFIKLIDINSYESVRKFLME